MAIQIPRIQRSEPTQTPSIGNIQVQAPSAEGQLKGMQTVQKVFESAADLAFKYQKQAQDNNVRELATQYKMKLYGDGTEPEGVWTVNKFQRTPKEGQDFTPYYGAYNDYRKKLKEEIMSSPVVSEAIRSRLENEISEADFYANRTVNIEYLKSNNVRSEKIHEADMNTRISVDLADAVAFYNPKDPETKERLTSVIAGIVDSTKQMLLKKDFKDKDPAMDSELTEVAGNVALIAATSALSTRDIDKAEAIYNEYKSIISPTKSQSLMTQISKVKEERKINEIVNAHIAEDQVTGMAKIRALDLPDDQKQDALRILIREKNRERQAIINTSRDNRNLLELMLKDRASKGNLPVSIEALQRDPDMAKLYKNITQASDFTAIDAYLGKHPKESDPVVLRKVDDMYESGDLYNLTPDQLKQEIAGLKNSDRNFYIERYAKKDRVGLQKRRGELSRQIKTFVKPGEFTDTELGIWSNYFAWELNRRMDKLNNTLDTKELKQYYDQWGPEFKKIFQEIKKAKKEDRDRVAAKYFNLPISEDEIRSRVGGTIQSGPNPNVNTNTIVSPVKDDATKTRSNDILNRGK